MFITKKVVSLQRKKSVSSSSLVRTSGFHPGNSGSNPGETTKENEVRKQEAHSVTCNLAFSVYKSNNMQKSFLASLIMVFFLLNGETLHAQEENYQFGVRGGIGMTTLTGFSNNGLKIGLTCGVFGKYSLTENSSIIADINYSTGGQQSERWVSPAKSEVKEYSKYNLHYFNLPILYQYYFTDILGIEAGANMRCCFAGNLKKKTGNEGWKKYDLDYNTFDIGMIIGLYTDNLILQDNFFVSLRAYFGFLDVVKEVSSNKNISIQISVGYTIF